MTNSRRLPTAIITRWPARTPSRPRPVAQCATSASSSAQVTARPPDSTTARRSGESSAASATRSARSVNDMHRYFHIRGRPSGVGPGRPPRPFARTPAAFPDYPERRDAARPPPPPQPAAALDDGRRGSGRGGRGGDGPRHPGRPHRGGVLRRRQHDHAGREHLPPGPRPAPPRVLHDARHPRRRLEAGLLPGRGGRGPRARGRRPQLRAGLHRRPHRQRARGPGRGDLRRGHGAPDLAGHPGAWPRCTSTRASGCGW